MIQARFTPRESIIDTSTDQFLIALVADKYMVLTSVEVEEGSEYSMTATAEYLTPEEFEKTYEFVGIMPNTEFQEVRKIS